jgi:ATP-dependent helicase/nuclease subunit A
MTDHRVPEAYEVDGRPADATEFVGIACDPRQSVVVEACAGSGKTWLLVARMLRLLLASAAPSEILAITFTRKAAQEMRERLMQLLQELALGTDEQVRALLAQRGIAAHDMSTSIPVARSLYGRVLASPQHLSIDTFHSWFGKIIQIAPLSSGVPQSCQLSEITGELFADAYGRFMQSLQADAAADIREALLQLYRLAGDYQARQLLDAFVDKRAEWWASTLEDNDGPLELLLTLCGDDGVRDARLTLWEDGSLCARILQIALLLGRGTKPNQDRAVGIETALSSSPCVEAFARLLDQFCDGDGDPRRNKHTSGGLKKVVEAHFGEQGCDLFEQEFNDIAEVLLQLQRRACEAEVLMMNRALFIAGSAYLEHYQQVKAERQVFDFADLEWHAYRLLMDSDNAAYLQSRLDARYKHILLDEFQDTNPLQWNIVRAWLDAYGSDNDQPSVFIVGDPKQSIYRFRRAEPRVFAAASAVLSQRGARLLRTNQTRRNAACIVEMLNACLKANRIFRPQTTLAEMTGQVWRLPLIQVQTQAEEPLTDIRNPLQQAQEEQEDARRREEGALVARALLSLRREYSGEHGASLRWSDVMVLVKKRTHLAAYETALRAAGIPFVSNRKGGLLDSLEAADLIALLTFLITPNDVRALAHVLKCPIFLASDDDLVVIAGRTENGWWERVQATVADGHATDALRRACLLLGEWLENAPRLPVHDLLDAILHQGEVLQRYAEASSAGARLQVIGNIEAFVELALNLDAGRYPSLPKFIDALRLLQRHAEKDAPDEAHVDAAADAVQIMTIHSAKGLEAEVVVLIDANHSEAKQDDIGILCDWPEDAIAPTHFSAFGKRAVRGAARDELFAREDGFRLQEDWNLLYVAATRAKRMLLVSGVADKKAGSGGISADSWYARLLSLDEMIVEEAEGQAEAIADAVFELPIFDPPYLPAVASTVSRRTEGMDEGVLLHALMERLTGKSLWPVMVPEDTVIARWLACPPDLAKVIREHTICMLGQPELERFFNPHQHHCAFNEMEVSCEFGWLRFDRVVLFDDEAWILDYKRNVLEIERTAYAMQLQRYREAAREIFPGRTLRTALITVDGRFHEIE